jgi:hypothetical protein
MLTSEAKCLTLKATDGPGACPSVLNAGAYISGLHVAPVACTLAIRRCARCKIYSRSAHSFQLLQTG